MTAPVIAAHGLRAVLPPRWEARLHVRRTPTTEMRTSAFGHPGEIPHPVLHLANFALPPDRGDFGSNAVDVMGPGHAFVALLEYERGAAHQPLFAAQGMPRPRHYEFAANALQHAIKGQGGVQRFFTANERAFCLYVVLGSLAEARVRVREVHGVLDNITIDRLADPR